MAWIGKSHGIFRLHDSDSFCGSYISVTDAAQILDISPSQLAILPTKYIDGQTVVSELDIHKAWGTEKIQSLHKPKYRNTSRSFDEIIVLKLLRITLPGCEVECQIPFGKKHVDLKLTYNNRIIFIEFVGPSHFTPQYQRGPTSPLARKKEVEDHFGCECVIWPFWIQRCSRNIHSLLDRSVQGLASVWSTKAFFGDFVFPKSAEIIFELTSKFNAVRDDGVGYMYGNQHTNKPIHPIVEAILVGRENRERLIPRGNDKPESFWLPKELR
jgi:hypothetical protein